MISIEASKMQNDTIFSYLRILDESEEPFENDLVLADLLRRGKPNTQGVIQVTGDAKNVFRIIFLFLKSLCF